MKTALLTVLTLGVCQMFVYADLYVSPSGRDTHNGLTRDAPFRTLARALRAAQDGKERRIVVLGALDAASEAGAGGVPDSVFYIRDTGSEEIVITGGGGSPAELRGMAGKRVLTVQGNAHILLQDLRLTAGDTPFNGGGVFIEGGSRLTLGKGAAVQGNRAQEGGGVYMRDGVFTLEADSVIADNAVRTDEGGGAVLFNTVFTMRDSAAIQGNSGGGIVLHGGTGTLLDNAAIQDNQCQFDGGGIALYQGELFIQGRAAVRGNHAGRNGGGIMVSLHGNVMIRDDASIADNQAGNDGGGVAVRLNSVCVVQGRGSITGNRAGDDGGAVYNLASELVLKEGARILDNTAACGGGVCAEGVPSAPAGASFGGASSFTVVQDQALVQGNKALGESQGGGGLCAGIDALILMKGGEVKENLSVNGGGVYIEGGSFKHSGGVVTDNAARHGGGLYKQSGKLRITNGDISGNAPNDIVNSLRQP
jgi:hypothetical protein